LRAIVFTIALLFIVGLGVLTGLDIARNGVTVIGVVSVLLLVVIMVGIVGALGPPSRR
jgi:hypothetical protein